MAPRTTARRMMHCLIWVAASMPTAACSAAQDTQFMAERRTLIAEIEDDYRRTAGYTGIAAMSERVREAMLAVPRHAFVQDADPDAAYGNYPLSIGYGQTISQPYIVAIMTDLLDIEAGDRLLEIGTGSGYQAAVLAELAAEVYSIEIVEPLAHAARDRLAGLGYANVQVRAGDGNLGWPAAAPFDGIIVTAGGNLPPALVEQLAPGGRLVIPIENDGTQTLTVISKASDGSISERAVLPVRFVPLTGDN